MLINPYQKQTHYLYHVISIVDLYCKPVTDLAPVIYSGGGPPASYRSRPRDLQRGGPSRLSRLRKKKRFLRAQRNRSTAVVVDRQNVRH